MLILLTRNTRVLGRGSVLHGNHHWVFHFGGSNGKNKDGNIIKTENIEIIIIFVKLFNTFVLSILKY